MIHEHKCWCGERASKHVMEWSPFSDAPSEKYFCSKHDPDGEYHRRQQIVYELAWRNGAHEQWSPTVPPHVKKARQYVTKLAEELGVESPTFS